MMHNSKILALAAMSSLALSACNKAGTETTASVTVHDEMVQTVIPQTQVIWDVSNQSLNDDGEPDPARMTDADWKKVKAASGLLIASLDRMATAEKVLVVKPGGKIQDQEYPGSPQPADVQARIDADLPGFHRHAKELKDFVGLLDKAVDAKDFKTFSAKAGEADAACEGCHKAYWLKPAA